MVLFKKMLKWESDFTFHHLDMGCMGHGRKFTSKIPIFTYSTRVHIDSTSNHSKSCRGLFPLHSVQF
jgi:hypothetical protein